MNTYKFKTNAKCGGCTAKIEESLKTNAGIQDIKFDLSDANKVLTVTTNLSESEVVKLVEVAGYKAEPLK